MNQGEREVRRVNAVSLRLAGYSRAQIAQALGVKTGGAALGRWLRGVPAPAWTKRPRAKDAVRARAIELRRHGMSYREIQETLGVSRSSLSLWLRDVPISQEHALVLGQRQRWGRLKGSAARRAKARLTERDLVASARSQVGLISARELFVAGVVAYWAEGAKTKPWGPRVRVVFTNSDPGMVRLFLGWLQLLDIPRRHLSFRVYIHEGADVGAALCFWSQVVGTPQERFLRTSMKRHNPRTVRKNVGGGYRGCLAVAVSRSADLNSRVRGWFAGIVDALPVANCTADGGVKEAGDSLILESIRDGVTGQHVTL